MERTLNRIATHIKGLSDQREALASLLRKIDSLKLFPKLANTIKPAELNNIKICGVDGGFLKKEYHGMGLILRRAVAAAFTYENNKLAKHEYFPSSRPMPEPIITGPEFPASEFNILANLKRVELELDTTIAAARQLHPEVLVADGSIVLYPTSMPDKKSKVYSVYTEIIEKYKELYEFCSKKNILLVGAVEDSQGKRYLSELKGRLAEMSKVLPEEFRRELPALAKVLDNTTDTLFLYYFLKAGQRTESFDYSSLRAELPILRDLGKWAGSLKSMYIKAVEYDRPLRLDFIGDADRIASIIFEISRQNRSYSYPSVLIEADARAKLQEHEIDIFKSAINEKIGRNPSLFELRRELRPF